MKYCCLQETQWIHRVPGVDRSSFNEALFLQQDDARRQIPNASFSRFEKSIKDNTSQETVENNT